jgi:hypothetical protein
LDQIEGEGEEAADPMSKNPQEPILLTDDGAIGPPSLVRVGLILFRRHPVTTDGWLRQKPSYSFSVLPGTDRRLRGSEIVYVLGPAAGTTGTRGYGSRKGARNH